MAELFMECEEEELEPWQQSSKEIIIDDDEDDDEPIFVREISVSKTTNTNNATGDQPGSFTQTKNGVSNQGNNAFLMLNNHCNPSVATHTVTQPVIPMFQPVSRPVTSSAIVQPLQRPLGMQEPMRKPAMGCMPAQQPPRANLAMQTVCRPQTFVQNPVPACRNPTAPTVSQPPLRPVATITAQPVILNQGYITDSSQVASNYSNVMFTLRPSTALTQYQSVQTFTASGSSTSLVRPLQPLPQFHPVSAPARTAPTFIHRPTPPAPPIKQNINNSVPGLQQPLLLHSQKTQQTVFMQNAAANSGRNENALVEKRPPPIDLTDDSPKKHKTNENLPDKRSAAASTTASTPMSSPGRQQQTTLLQNTKGANAASTPTKNGTQFPRACPKCNIHFNLLEPMKKHMTYCCPEKMHIFFSCGVTNSTPINTEDDNEKGKLIMLVSDFYYGRYTGDLQLMHQEEKTHNTFKCFSCQKVLRNNIKFMNHMKHHLELEKQSTESWENHTTCHHCHRQFSTPFQLQCHIESSHTLYESTTICKICELSFDSEQILLQHMKDNHKPGEMPYVCQVCNYRSSVFADVDNHFRSTHENTKSLLCPFCLKVIKSGTPYMQHYMKHQNKGVYRCAKCRLQFLSCKEKMDHKTQHHRTFRKPKQLEGLPPGTKVTIRASVGVPSSPVSSPTSSISKNPTLQPQPLTQTATPPQPSVLPLYSLPKSPPKMKPKNPKSNLKPTAKIKVHSSKTKSSPKKPVTVNTARRNKMINTALQNLRVIPGIHKCIECHRQVVDFEGHFHTYIHCSKCKFSTNCNKAYTNHVVRFHGRNSSKRSKASKKGPCDKRRITVVCLNCDFLTDVSGLDDMARHLSENHTHSCQVVTENVSIFSSTHEGDMSISRLQFSIELKKIREKMEKPDSHAEGDESLEEDTPVATKEEDNSHESNTSVLSEAHTTSVMQVPGNIEIPDSCSPKSEEGTQLIDSYNKDDCDIVQEKVSSEMTSTEPSKHTDSSTEPSKHTDSKIITNENDNVCLVLKEDYDPDSDISRDDAGFDQYFSKQAPQSECSDISEPSSIHLDPLTPSEVLEHEATEILQKGTVVDRSEEKAEDTKDSSTNISDTIIRKEEPEEAL
ncbi:zinc finger protein 280D isoform X2 [Hyla sarda]|nr:zinc finger protein 280D isoform X2 [Hyla sarda]XP_056428369.1 zinc finger protein 280D isoform X2 [Hyla sarda]XP_056428370.1 zinc finger protein 280D isoform X2 [Hyla sarda]